MTSYLENCPCGAQYKITEHKMIARDKDSIECRFCDRTMIDWNGGVMYSAQLIKAPEPKSE